MILEYLLPDPSVWEGLTVVNRALYYATSLAAAGTVFFLATLGDRLTAEEQGQVRRMLVLCVVGAVAFSLLAWPLRAAVLSKDGLAGFWRFDLYGAVARSRIGDAFFLRLAGLGLVLAALSNVRAALPVAAVGAVMVCASYAAMGHSTLYKPRQELAVFTTTHLAAVAFWIGSLWPLRIVAQRGDASVGAVMEAFSRIAVPVVAVLAAVGAIAAWYLVGRADLLVSSWYGWGLMAKLVLVTALFGFAVRHKWRLTPDVIAGVPGAAARLRRSIGREMVVALLVFYAVAEMVSVHPVDYGHRISG